MSEPLRSHWLSEHWHAVGWLAFGVLVVGLYVWVHVAWRCDYVENIRPHVTDAVRLYALRRHVVTGALELRVGDDPYKFDPDERGPLGIGGLPEARGVITEALDVVERYNKSLHEYIDGLTGAFYPSPNNQHDMLADLTTVHPKADIAKLDEADSDDATDSDNATGSDGATVRFVLRVSVESFLRVRHQYPNEMKLDALVDLIRGAKLVRYETDKPAEDVTDAAARGTIKSAADAVRDREKELRKGVHCLFESTTRAIPETPASVCPDAEERTNSSEALFHRQLLTVVERNASFFWTASKFLWFEIMMLAALGVVTRRVVLFARAYAGGRDGQDATRIWEPRESMRTLMQLAAAPVFSLVIIWILTLTHIISVKPLIGDVWSNATVPLAFLLGLFPSLGYEVLRGVAEGVFGQRLLGEKAAEARPMPITDAPPGTADGGAASFERLRQRVRLHATAVFKE